MFNSVSKECVGSLSNVMSQKCVVCMLSSVSQECVVSMFSSMSQECVVNMFSSVFKECVDSLSSVMSQKCVVCMVSSVSQECVVSMLSSVSQECVVRLFSSVSKECVDSMSSVMSQKCVVCMVSSVSQECVVSMFSSVSKECVVKVQPTLPRQTEVGQQTQNDTAVRSAPAFPSTRDIAAEVLRLMMENGVAFVPQAPQSSNMTASLMPLPTHSATTEGLEQPSSTNHSVHKYAGLMGCGGQHVLATPLPPICQPDNHRRPLGLIYKQLHQS
ncbi:uncharacterized protein LOC110448880 [Mizuhopecten yessoensis]|uniref:uncharacterized protein LOC110448880 n=1 Tax=Mizuhopecten yessoensis TaxID=6573 RepID=UPI000B45B89F|nr:uncharacterized protein LOC110448880 [Mizuhopecten yessoensis]